MHFGWTAEESLGVTFEWSGTIEICQMELLREIAMEAEDDHAVAVCDAAIKITRVEQTTSMWSVSAIALRLQCVDAWNGITCRVVNLEVRAKLARERQIWG